MIRPLTLALLLALSATPVAAKEAAATDYAAALADPARPPPIANVTRRANPPNCWRSRRSRLANRSAIL